MARRAPIDGRAHLAARRTSWRYDPMVKPEWGTKRSCPKCSTRFYDLGKDDPITCIACGNAWAPEPVLKSKQPLPFEVAAPEKVKEVDEDLADEEVDLATGEDDLGVTTGDEDEEG